jgi:hypothetical protein
MYLPVVIPDAIEPGQRWKIEEADLPPGITGLRIGDVHTLARVDGRPASVLVVAARWGAAAVWGRVAWSYDVVALAERIDATLAAGVLDALLDHVVTTGDRIVLARAGTDVAFLTPVRPDAGLPVPPPFTVSGDAPGSKRAFRSGESLRAISAGRAERGAAKHARQPGD